MEEKAPNFGELGATEKILEKRSKKEKNLEKRQEKRRKFWEKERKRKKH